MKYPFETLGGAVAAFDFDDDGWVDLLFLNGAPSPEHVRRDPASFNRLFRNTGHGRFVDVTAESGLSGAGVKGYPQGVAVGDYDNDGYPDVLVTNYGDNVLYHNDGKGHFTDVTARGRCRHAGAPAEGERRLLRLRQRRLARHLRHPLLRLDACEAGRRLVRPPRARRPHLLRPGRVRAAAQRPAAQQPRRHLQRRLRAGRPRPLPRQGHGGGRGRLRRRRAHGRLRDQRPRAALPVPQHEAGPIRAGRVRGRRGAERVGRAGLRHGLRLRGLRRRRLARHLPDRPEPRRVHPVRQPADGVLRRPQLPLRARIRLDGAQRLEHEDAGHRRRRPQGHLRGRLARGRQRHTLQPGRASTRRAASSTATSAAGGSRTSPNASGPTCAPSAPGAASRWPTSTTTARRRWPCRG